MHGLTRTLSGQRIRPLDTIVLITRQKIFLLSKSTQSYIAKNIGIKMFTYKDTDYWYYSKQSKYMFTHSMTSYIDRKNHLGISIHVYYDKTGLLRSIVWLCFMLCNSVVTSELYLRLTWLWPCPEQRPELYLLLVLCFLPVSLACLIFFICILIVKKLVLI